MATKKAVKNMKKNIKKGKTLRKVKKLEATRPLDQQDYYKIHLE